MDDETREEAFEQVLRIPFQSTKIMLIRGHQLATDWDQTPMTRHESLDPFAHVLLLLF